MSSTLPRRTAALAVLSLTAVSGMALTGVASAHTRALSHTSLSIRAVRSAINPGGGDVIKGDLQAFDGQNAGRRITLYSRSATAAWTAIKRHRTGAHGLVGFQVTPLVSTAYQLRFNGNRQQAPSRSGVVYVRVLDTTSLVISVGAASIEPGASDTVNGVLSLDGNPLVGDTVKLFSATRHNKLAYTASAITAADGTVSFGVTPPSTSHYALVFKKTVTNAGARSAVATIRVRLPSSLSIRARANKKTGNEIISGDLRGSNHGLVHRKVSLQDRASGSATWTTVTSKFTRRHGGVGFSIPAPTANEDYQLVFAGGPVYDGCQSGVVTVNVD